MSKENQLQIIVNESGLETTKAQFILEKFQTYFQIAAEWEVKAKSIVVKDETQKADMQMARTGRLFLREKRIAIEKARKQLKEQALREGRAIDGIANVLKGLIEPIEKYLDSQEHFVEIRAKEKAEQERLEAERKAEEERIAREKAEAEERERIRLENEKLKAEAEKQERKARAEREKAEAKLRAEREKAERERYKLEEKARKEREKADQLLREQQAEADRKRLAAEKKAEVERAKQEKLLAEQINKAEEEKKERERAQELLRNQITCPFCKRKFERGVQ